LHIELSDVFSPGSSRSGGLLLKAQRSIIQSISVFILEQPFWFIQSNKLQVKTFTLNYMQHMA